MNFTTRPELSGTFGMVASTHWLASAAGMATLEQGGNAFDAAVAAGLTLQVVEPHLNGPGGDAPILLYDAARGEPVVVCGQGPAPSAATIPRFRELGLELVPGSGLLAACVPGAFDAWLLLLRDYGTLPLAEVMRFPIHYAEHGFPMLPRIAETIAEAAPLFREEWPSSAELWLEGGPRAAPGRHVAQRDARGDVAAARRGRRGGRAGPGGPDPGGARRVPARLRRRGDRGLRRPRRGDGQLRAAQPRPAVGRRHGGVLGVVRAAGDVRAPRADRLQGRAVEPGAGAVAGARAARGLRPRGDGPPVGRLRPHGPRVREARVRRPRGVVRRSGVRGRAAGDAGERCVRRGAPGARGRGGVVRPAAGVAGRAVAGAAADPGRRGGRGRRVRRRGAHARPRGRPGRGRHVPRRRRRPAREHGLGDAERRVAALLPRDPGPGPVPGHARADVLADRGAAERARAGQAPAHDADPVARAARRRGRARVGHAGRRRTGPVVAAVPPVASGLRAATCRRRSTRRRSRRRTSRRRSTRGSRSPGTWRSSRGPARA